MSYTIVWTKTALEWLADGYRTARLAGRADDFRRAVNRIEWELQRNPGTLGESRSRGERAYFDLPASVRVRVDDSGRRAIVLDVLFHS